MEHEYGFVDGKVRSDG